MSLFNNYHISINGINLIKYFEGCKLTAYFDSKGVITIVIGHTGPDVYKGLVITQEQADNLLDRDLDTAENAVNLYVNKKISQNMFDALVSFSFNVGGGNLKSSTLLRLINLGMFNEASKQFIRWNKAGGKVLSGLTRRRQAEQALFNSSDWTIFKK
jgi:lysozyme